MRNVYITGPSCGGKTTMVHYLRMHGGSDLNIPIRILSRRSRGDVDLLENRFLEKEEFERTRNTSEFFISWHRVFEEGRKEYYGFLAQDVTLEKINVFSGNNSLFLYPESIYPQDVFTAHESSFVVCTAPDELRMRRLKERSPEYSDAEVEIRIHKESIESHLEKADLIINSSEEGIEEAGERLLSFIHKLSN